MAGISFSGIGSGLPVQEIIGAVMKAESVPLQRMEYDKKFFESQISALGQLSSRLGSLKGAMDKLKGADKFQHMRATSSNEDLFTANADFSQGANVYNGNIKVLAEARNFAQFTQATNDTSNPINAGMLNFHQNGQAIQDENGNDIQFDTTGKSLEDIRDAINSDDALKDKVSASIVKDGDNYRLSLNSLETGKEGAVVASFDGGGFGIDNVASDDAANLEALNAKIQVGGGTGTGLIMSSSTNTFQVADGIEITLKAGSSELPNTTANLRVGRDDDKIKDHIDEFVKAYNDVMIHINEAKKSSLYGDSTLRSVEAEMRNVLYTPTEGVNGGDANKNFLALIGIEVHVNKSYDPDNPDSQNGTLKINAEKLKKALDEDFEGVSHILGATSDDENGVAGYAERFSNMAQNLMSGGVSNGEAYKGLLQIRTEGLGNQAKQIGRAHV